MLEFLYAGFYDSKIFDLYYINCKVTQVYLNFCTNLSFWVTQVYHFSFHVRQPHTRITVIPKQQSSVSHLIPQYAFKCSRHYIDSTRLNPHPHLVFRHSRTYPEGEGEGGAQLICPFIAINFCNECKRKVWDVLNPAVI